MYKLIIADDEKNIREGLKNIIPWQELGFEVAAVFDDGAGVLTHIEMNHVDVILTDIKMKNISGIDIAKHVNTMESRPIILFLSGYKEFDLAYQAMQNNVYSYILKPAKNSEIVELFKKLKEKLDSENISDEVGNFGREQIVLDILTGSFTDESDMIKQLKTAGVPVSEDSSFTFITFKIKDYNFFTENVWKSGKDHLYIAIKNFLSNTPNSIEFIPLYRIGDIIPIFGVISGSTIGKEEIKAILDDIIEQIESEMKAVIAATIRSVYKNVRELVTEKPFFDVFKGAGSMVTTEYATEICNLLLLEVYKKNTEEQIQTILDGIKENIKAANDMEWSKLLLISICNELVLKMQATNKEFALPLLEISIKEIRAAKDFTELDTANDNLFGKLVEMISSDKLTSPEMIVNQIKLYIEDNFEKDITLQDIAENVYLSTAYISRLFKRHAGETVSDYIIKVRMEYAMVLLKQKKLKIYEVCYKVGYKSKKYFNITFKKYTGKSPTDYRENL